MKLKNHGLKLINYQKTFEKFFSELGRQKKEFLRKKPWYLVLGKAKSGKTEFLNQSHLTKLHFLPFLDPDVKAIDSCFHCHLTQEAVFFEFTVGQVLSEQLAIPLWYFIRKHRRENPLNGIIITIAIPDLFQQTEDSFTLLEELKTTLSGLHSVLHYPIPYSIVITKSDLLSGFREFFADLGKEEREQLWGFVFPQHTPLTCEQLLAFFHTEFTSLINRLQKRVLHRLELERYVESRYLISYFPQQLQLCKERLEDYLQLHTPLPLRGIYFVSSLQEGNSIDPVMANVIQRFNLPNREMYHYFPQHRAYFLQYFFQDAIFPDSQWHKQSTAFQFKQKRYRQFSYICSVVVLFACTLGWFCSYQENERQLNALSEYLPAYQKQVLSLAPSSHGLLDALPQLNELKEIKATYSLVDSPWLVWLELYQPLRIRKELASLWQTALTHTLLPRVALRLEELLAQPAENDETRFAMLKGYLALQPHSKITAYWLTPPIEHDLSNAMKNDRDRVRQFQDYFNEAIHYPLPTWSLRENLIAKARNQLLSLPIEELAYFQLKQTAQVASPAFNLADQMGADFSVIFTETEDKKIPWLYTNSGYQQFKRKVNHELVKHIAPVYDVLGLTLPRNRVLLRKQMMSKIWQLYGQDYAFYWQKALMNLHITPWANVNQAIQALKVLTKPSNPLTQILTVVRENTQPLQALVPQFATMNAQKITVGDDRYKAIESLRDYFSQLNLSDHLTQQEFADASALAQQKLTHHPILNLRWQAQPLAIPLRRWLNEIADQSVKLLAIGAEQVINNAWQTQVLSYYKENMMNHMPFTAHANDSVSLNTFSTFLGGNGILMQFFHSYLSPFFTISPIFNLLTKDFYPFTLEKSAGWQWQRLLQLQHHYFPNNTNTLDLMFSIKPTFLSANASSVYLQLGSQSLLYRHGPPVALNWHWPADTPQSSFSFNDFTGRAISESMEGPWSWLQLLQKGQLHGENSHYHWVIERPPYTASYDIEMANVNAAFDIERLENLQLSDSLFQ